MLGCPEHCVEKGQEQGGQQGAKQHFFETPLGATGRGRKNRA